MVTGMALQSEASLLMFFPQKWICSKIKHNSSSDFIAKNKTLNLILKLLINYVLYNYCNFLLLYIYYFLDN